MLTLTFRCSYVSNQPDHFGDFTVHLNSINSPHDQGYLVFRLKECDFKEGELYRVTIEDYDQETVTQGLQ